MIHLMLHANMLRKNAMDTPHALHHIIVNLPQEIWYRRFKKIPKSPF
jgi:hypothetical protein